MSDMPERDLELACARELGERLGRPFETLAVEDRGNGQWAVTRPRRCLGVDGEWDWEPIPSEREDDWLAAHRFDLATALALAKQAAPTVAVNGITAAQAAARRATGAPAG